MSWIADSSLAEKNRFKDYAKKHGREYVSCFANLDAILSLLNAGTAPSMLGVSYFRSEGKGLYRIGQTRVPHAKETRLYVYVQVKDAVLFVLTIGDKDHQPDDIRRCQQTIEANFKRG